ncbi:MAG: cytidine deaminase [Clostridia bacterium]|nr:cytidine deaminase [Clostridia bacterium]
MKRRDKTNYYLDIAQTVASRGTCLRRNYGAIIVSHDQIISTGYTGAPRGRENCCDLGFCLREKMNIPRGERYEMCRSVHAEANAIIAAARDLMIGATMYVVGLYAQTGELVSDSNSCQMCKRMIINAGISEVVFRRSENDFEKIRVCDWIENDDSLNEKFGY